MDAFSLRVKEETVAFLPPSQPANLCVPLATFPPNSFPPPRLLPLEVMRTLPSTGTLSLCGFYIFFNKMHFTFFFF